MTSNELIARIAKHVSATRQAEVLVVFMPIGEMDLIQEQLRDSDIPRDAVDVLVLEDSPK